MKNYRLHFIRHGMTEGNQLGQYIGRTDLPVCAEGMEQLRCDSERYRYPWVQKVYRSPLLRCAQTAEVLYPDVYEEVLDDLIEYDFGEFEGKTFAQLKDDERFVRWMEGGADVAAPGGESGRSCMLRLTRAVETIFDDMMQQQLTDVAVITHGGVLMSLFAAFGFPRRPMREWAVGNGKGYTVLMTPQLWMRDHAFEIFAPIPDDAPTDDEDAMEEYFG